MRIAWFTPLAGASAIAEMCVHVTDALAQDHDVELWQTDRSTELRGTALPVRRYPAVREAIGQLEHCDIAVYNIGDSDFHTSVLPIARAHPGVVVLHDVVLQHLFAQLLVVERADPELYVEIMTRHYGAPGRDVARATVDGVGEPIWRNPEALVRFPLFEEALEGALGVVTHSGWQQECVEGRWVGSTCQLFGPNFPTDWDDLRSGTGELADDGDERAVLLAVGSVHVNKRVDHVIEVLGRCPDLARRARLVVIGQLQEDGPYAQALRRRISHLGLERTVSLRGRESDAVLRAWMARADIFVNLRQPAMEGGSGSLSRELPRGKPVVVYDTGVFSDIPPGAAVKLAPGDLDGLERELRELLDDPARCAMIGAAGARYARGLSAERYARELSSFLERIARDAPLWSACDRAGRQMGAIDVDARIGSYEVVRDELVAMFRRTQ